MRVTSFNISDDLYKRVNFASAGLGLSSSEYIRRALVSVLVADALIDPTLAAAFRAMDEMDRQRREAAAAAERVKVSA